MEPVNLKAQLRALRDLASLRQASWIGLRGVRERHHIASAQDGHVRDAVREETHGVMVEVFVRGHAGYAATSDRTGAGLRAAAERALAQALASEHAAVARFGGAHDAPLVRPPSTGAWASATAPAEHRIALDGIPLSDLVLRAVALSSRMRITPQIVQATCSIDVFESDSELVSSSGADMHQALRALTFQLEATSSDAGVTQKRSFGDTLQAGANALFQDDIGAHAERTAREALELLHAPECPTETMDLVLMPSQMTLQIHESIGHPLELDRILGDERNYAGWSFVRLKDFGTLQYGSPLLNVTFDPTIDDEIASYGFDDCGNPARREYIIRDGRLLRALGSLESQERAGVLGVANFRASSWNRPAVDRMANINVEPGSSTFEEIISSVERGILMDTNRSWSIDDYRNKFQFGCEYGRLIDDGRLTTVVRNPNYRGVTTPFWNALRMVGDVSTLETHGTPMCGKAEPNQIIRVGHRSPVCRFSHVDVFGGAG